MAHHKDALKRIRQNEKRSLRNKSVRTHYRNRVREVREAVGKGDAEAAGAALDKAIRSIDNAVSKNVLHRNTAARYKSRLSRAVAAVKAS